MPNADQIIELFNEAKACPTGPERERFLAEACGNDAGLREQIVSLIEAEADDRSKLFDRGLIRRSAVLTTEKVGDRIGRYKLLENIGEGGCGVVYMAEQEEPVRRRVALKIIKLGMDTKSVVARFEAERQALAMMDHPNIAKVFDGGATDTGRPYFVMELVRGIKITDFCDQNAVPIEERLRLLMNVCEAIQHAHVKGIIHRDIKPSNILVSSEDGRAVPKVIDFGIAKATEQSLTDKTIFTAFEQFIGTPAYMSPEQAKMTNADIDTRSDIYSLGVLLYELLTGHTPFDTQALIASGMQEVQRVIRESEPPKPSDRLSTLAGAELTTVAGRRLSEPPKLLHKVRGDLDWIAMKCLEKDRTRRYETASGLAADLQRHLNNEPVVARPPSKAYQFKKLVRRNKLAFAAGTAIASALVIGFATTTWMYFREREARKRANAERDAKEVARQEAEAIATFLREVFMSPNPARDGRTITVAETLDKAAKKVEIDLAGQPGRRAKLQRTLGWTYASLGLPHTAGQLQEKVLNHYRTASGPEHPDTLLAMHDVARAYAVTRRADEALRLREKVVEARRKRLSAEDPDMLAAMGALADSYGQVGRLEEALTLRQELLPLIQKVSGAEHITTIWMAQNLSLAYAALGRVEEAHKVAEEVHQLCRNVLGPEHPTTLAGMHYLADFQWSIGQRTEALKLREATLPLRRKVLGPEHPDTLSTMGNLVTSYFDVGRKDEALKLREEILTLRTKSLGRDHPSTLAVMTNLARAYADTGRLDDALKLEEEVLILRSKAKAPEHPDTLRAMQELAEFYLRRDRLAEATPLLAAASTRKPEDTSAVLKAATIQLWFAQGAEYDRTRQHVIKWAADDLKPEDAERIARISCLRPIDDAPTREATLAVARRALELGRGNNAFLPFAHLVLGMAEYRSGHYAAADEALLTAAKTASAAGIYYLQFTASFYRAMSLFRQGRHEEARELFAYAEVKMKPFPIDEKTALSRGSNVDDFVLWLACKEARALLNIPPPSKP